MAVIEWKKDEGVAIVTMNNGENRHNPVFVDTFLNTFDEIEKDKTITSVVITSSDKKCWSLGIDLGWMMEAIGKEDFDALKGFMYGLNKVFSRVLSFPMPVIAAINGHVFGDGSILACACDYRFMKADKGFFCFPEVDIDIPFLPGMLEIVKKAFPYYKAEELIFSGKKTGAKELEEHHVVVKACADQEELMKDAIAFARTYTKKRPIFQEHKKRLHKGIFEAIEKEDPVYIDALKLGV
ncbi:MAG: enoyl-CoA hydratase/isomerase family protein [Thermodesulfobacteriota bacterium]|nr:enoyl-CoA hydratase/isomerase family protein [Thermodesulfobacteriota bacterium]